MRNVYIEINAKLPENLSKILLSFCVNKLQIGIVSNEYDDAQLVNEE